MYGVATMCRVLAVSASGYYAWRQRPPSARARTDAELTTRIRAIHQYSRGTYGAPRVHEELLAAHIHSGRKPVARLMKAAALRGASRRPWVITTVRDQNAGPATDLVERNFTAAAPDLLWVADITYIPTWAGFLYLAVVLDAFSRRIVGWAMATHLRTELACGAQHGHWPAPARRRDSSLRPGQPARANSTILDLGSGGRDGAACGLADRHGAADLLL
jgi:putative transposase